MTPQLVALHEADVSLVLDVAGVPAIVHWGGRLPDIDPSGLGGLLAATAKVPFIPNGPDAGVRLSLVPEASTGWQGRPGLTGSRAGADWSPRWTAVGVRFEDQPLEGPIANVGVGVLDVDVADEASGLAMRVSVAMLPGGLVRARADLTNTGADDYEVRELLVAFGVPDRAREGLDFGGRWLTERVPQRWSLDQGTRWREARHGRTGADSAYLLHLGTPGFTFAEGELWAVHTAWSGNHIHYAERTNFGEQIIGGGELLLPGEGELAPGASYRTPWVYACYGRGLDAIAQRFHGWLRSRPALTARSQGADPGERAVNGGEVVGAGRNTPRPVSLNVWEAVYFDHRLDKLTALAEKAAEVGVERYVLDDGWFGARRHDRAGLGDWVVSDEAWPAGLTPLISTVNSLGMQFGLWVEPEMVNLDSDVARAHPEWIMQPGHGRLPVPSRNQHVLNLSIPDAYVHVRTQLFAILDAHPIAYLKWDHNRDLVEAGMPADGRPAVHEQTLAVYRLMDELKAAHPGLEIESCSSGGGRVDLEIMERCDRIWVSDCIDPHERAESQRWTAQLLPPELMGTHIASGRSHTTQRQHDLSFRAATALFGHLGIEWDLTAASEAELVELKAWVALYKAWRGVLHAGRVVRAEDRDGLWVHGVVADDAAIFFVGLLDLPPWLSLGRVTLPGLDPDAEYRVEVLSPGLPEGTIPAPWMMAGEPMVLTGRVLGEVGLVCPLLSVDHALVVGLTKVDASA